MAKKPTYPPADKIAQFDAVLAAHPDVERKGKTNPYSSLNGHMFLFLDKEGKMGVRLGKEDKAAFEAAFNSPPYLQYGKVMRGYVTVPDELFMDTEAMQPWLQKSLDYIRSLEPK